MPKSLGKAVLLLVLFGMEACAPPQWNDGADHRWIELRIPRQGHTGFTRLTASETGIEAANVLAADHILENQLLMNGSGVAAGDIDGDGLVDLYFSRLDSSNVLYRNLGGWRFRDVTLEAGVEAAGRNSTGAAFADTDGDGDLDLFVTALDGPNLFFENDSTGMFVERTEAVGLESGSGSTSMTLADVDLDGDLDLFLANYKSKSVRDLYSPEALAFDSIVEIVAGDTVIRAEFRDHYGLRRRDGMLLRFEHAEPNRLYLNDGTGTFVDVSAEPDRFQVADGSGYASLREWTLTARFFDVDRDGDPDLYVCNDFESPDRFWINDGTGRFQLVDSLALRATSGATMGMGFSDVELDGDTDLLLLDMLDAGSRRRKTQTFLNLPDPIGIGDVGSRSQLPRNTLQINRGDGTFAEAAWYAGVEGSGWSWTVEFIDVDLDGYEDALITNGYPHDFLDLDTRISIQRTMSQARGALSHRNRMFLLRHPPLPLHNVIFHNRHDLTFEEVGEAWGFGVEADIAQGMATADLDGDGDLDVVANRLNAPAAIYRNETNAPRVAVRLRGLHPNTQGIGARLTVEGGAAPVQYREVTLGNYLSSSEPLHVFGTGEADGVRITVRWPNGMETTIADARPNRLYEIHESGAMTPERGDNDTSVRPLFVDASDRLGHRHRDTFFDDRRRQPLLRSKLSQLGPGVTWYDVDGDGDEDLLVASGAGGALSYLRNDDGVFVDIPLGVTQRDQTTVLPLPYGSGMTHLLVGVANYESANPMEARAVPSVIRVDPATPRSPPSAVVPGHPSSVGPLAIADYDVDGDLDLFVGGRVLPARYPMPASSRLFLNEGGAFTRDERADPILGGIGMVSAATFSDVDGDGDPDLLLATDWGSIRLLQNAGGEFTDRTDRWGLGAWLSRWNGITTGDIDGDGRVDIVATSWGSNTRLEATTLHPLRAYYGDFDGNGVLDIVDARFDPRIGDVAPLRSSIPLSLGIPNLGASIESRSWYADASIHDLLGNALDRARVVEANSLEHAIWFNRGDVFEREPLPRDAQLAPAFHVGVADVDGDGFEDVILSQNFTPTEMEAGAYNAGRGLILKGDGRGGLVPLNGSASGLRVYGDQRGAAFADYDRDGRVDLAVSQHGAETRLLRNAGGARGILVRLAGPPHNPYGIGAQIRLVYATRRGPVREIHGGSGYWSMNGPTAVLGGVEGATAVWVRWPGGDETETPITEGMHEISIRAPR